MKDKKTLYLYGMRLRGFSPGCQPMEGLVGCWDDPREEYQVLRDLLEADQYHDVLIYDRELSRGELLYYDLGLVGTIEGKVTHP